MTVDDLQQLGMTRMDREEVQDFLASQGTGVLGLPTAAGPYLLPLSFGFDGEESLYFTYILGEQSRKRELSERAEQARFLVYDVTSKFMWESVALAGPLSPVPPSGWDDIEAALRNAWHPDIFEAADLEQDVRVYEFRIEEWSGFKQTGLPPGLAPDDG